MKKSGGGDRKGEGGKKKLKISWDEAVIAEHDKERGSRMKIDEPKTPYYNPDHDGSQHAVSPTAFEDISVGFPPGDSGEGGGRGGASGGADGHGGATVNGINHIATSSPGRRRSADSTSSLEDQNQSPTAATAAAAVVTRRIDGEQLREKLDEAAEAQSRLVRTPSKEEETLAEKRKREKHSKFEDARKKHYGGMAALLKRDSSSFADDDDDDD